MKAARHKKCSRDDGGIPVRVHRGRPWSVAPRHGRSVMRTRPTHTVVLAIAIFIVAGCATGRMDYTGGRPDVCEVHHQQMQKTIVPAYYGLMPVTPRDEAMYSARTNTFPHAEDSVNPGCDPRGPREAVVYSCPECVRVRHLWEADYDAKH
jgi:hypothetical protein